MTDTLTKTAAANAPINDTRKAELLSKTVKHIDITSFDARPIVDAMSDMSFTSRDLGRATKIYNQMLADKDCTVVLVIAGSTSAGGCMDLYAELIRNKMVDVVVATGATIVDMDFFEGLGHKHYQALEIPDDDTLRSLYIDRIYDTYIDEEQLQDCDHTILQIADSLEAKPYSSRAFIREMGKYLAEHGKKDNSLV
jgi:deoxyhypusine synthase